MMGFGWFNLIDSTGMITANIQLMTVWRQIICITLNYHVEIHLIFQVCTSIFTVEIELRTLDF